MSMSSRRAARVVDWQAVPSSALVHALHLASTWQTPATCQASLVCRTWRQISRGCSGMVLLYVSGFACRDESFAQWLLRNAHQVGALTLCGANINRTLSALAQAVAAATAAGRALPMHTLRVLDLGPQLGVTQQLLAGLPHLRHLQLPVPDPQGEYPPAKPQHKTLLQHHLGPLHQLRRLKELHLTGPASSICCQGMAQLLPLSLQRLSWHPSKPRGREAVPLPDLRHMAQLTSLKLEGWATAGATSRTPLLLPAELQELQLQQVDATPAVCLQAAGVLTGYAPLSSSGTAEPMEQLTQLTRLRAWKTGAKHLCDPKVVAAFPHIGDVAHLHVLVKPGQHPSTYLAAVADGLPHLRHLHLEFEAEVGAAPAGLAALSGLTRLGLSSSSSSSSVGVRPQDAASWGPALGQLVALRWLSLPVGVLALTAPCLGRLQQLVVLALTGLDDFVNRLALGGELLEMCVAQAPQQLQVLGVYDAVAHEAVSWRLWRRLAGLLDARASSRTAQVVVGVDLEVVGEPGQGWAGLPEGLQKALMAPSSSGVV